MSLPSTPSRQHVPLAGRRILVVEDEYFLADDIGKALRALGAEVAGPVGHVEDAIEILRNGSVLDAAVLDVEIRTQMVFPLARALRERRVPFVFTTGFDKASIETEFQDVPLWEKPIDIVAMARTLVRLVGNEQGDAQRGASPPSIPASGRDVR